MALAHFQAYNCVVKTCLDKKIHENSFPLHGFNASMRFGDQPYSYALPNIKEKEHYYHFNLYVCFLQIFECKELSLETFTQRNKTKNVIVFVPWKYLACGSKPS